MAIFQRVVSSVSRLPGLTGALRAGHQAALLRSTAAQAPRLSFCSQPLRQNVQSRYLEQALVRGAKQWAQQASSVLDVNAKRFYHGLKSSLLLPAMEDKNHLAMIFDLDFTVLEGDVESLFAEYLISSRWIENPDAFHQMEAQYFAQYNEGTLDADTLSPIAVALKGHSEALTHQLIDEFVSTEVVPKLRPEMVKLIKLHKEQGGEVLLASASIGPLVRGVGKHLGLNQGNCLAVELALDDEGHFNGKQRQPNLGPYKAERVMEWLENQGLETQHACAFTDSSSDRCLLDAIHDAGGLAYAVTPDSKLRAEAVAKGWPVIDAKLQP